MYPLFTTFVTSLVAALVLTPIARGLARRWGVLDCPDGNRKLQMQPVPLWGGVAVYVALFIGLCGASLALTHESAALPRMMWVVSAAAGCVCLFGCLDDSFDLKPYAKLVLQIASTVPIVVAGYHVQRISFLGHPIELGLLGVPLTMAWLVVCINALNLLDGMDGLASVVGVSTAGMIALIAASGDHSGVALIAAALAGALSGFLVYNLPPASIYLGDSGSMVIGLVVGILAIQGSFKASATLSMTVPAVVMTIPMLDTSLAILRRRLSGRRIDMGDRGHIHHRLLDMGLSKWQALCIIGALCLTTGAAAAAASYFHNDALAWIAVIGVVVLLVRKRAFGHDEVALVKLAITSFLTRIFRWSSPPRDLPEPLSRETVAGMPFVQAWETLSREAAKCDVSRVELLVGNPAGVTGYHVWQRAPSPVSDQTCWTHGVKSMGSGQQYCELRFTRHGTALSQTWTLLQLTRFSHRFSEYWAENLDEIPRTGDTPPPHTLPFRVDTETHDPQKRAA